MVSSKKGFAASMSKEERLFLKTHNKKKGQFKPSTLKKMLKTEMSAKLEKSGVKVLQKLYYDPKTGQVHCYTATPSKKAVPRISGNQLMKKRGNNYGNK